MHTCCLAFPCLFFMPQVLQAKLSWLLKRPVFFKGQLLRGEIHAITDQQRAQSFAQVTEQRSKLGELLLVLYRMLQA